jgi:putative nucleotidyltransferase with HDIG domain
MLNRIKQVYAALTAAITPEDRKFISAYLNADEQNLFWGMNVPDQRHVLNVAYTALHLAEGRQPIVNITLLIQCALLHDVGKIKGDVSTFDKIITVIGHKFLCKKTKKWARQGRGSKLSNIRHAFHIYFNHGERSAAMLKAIGKSSQVVEIVAKHHKTPADDDPLELILLRQSDNMH